MLIVRCYATTMAEKKKEGCGWTLNLLKKCLWEWSLKVFSVVPSPVSRTRKPTGVLRNYVYGVLSPQEAFNNFLGDLIKTWISVQILILWDISESILIIIINKIQSIFMVYSLCFIHVLTKIKLVTTILSNIYMC